MGSYATMGILGRESRLVEEIKLWLETDKQFFRRKLTLRRIDFDYNDSMTREEIEKRSDELWKSGEDARDVELEFVIRKHRSDRYSVSYGRFEDGKWYNRLGVSAETDNLIDMARFVFNCMVNDLRTFG